MAVLKKNTPIIKQKTETENFKALLTKYIFITHK